MNQAILESWRPQALGVLRIIAALLFMEHGTQKVFGFPPLDYPQPDVFSLFWYGGILEFGGGLLLLLGLFTRPVAFTLSGQMAVAYWAFHHASDNIFPVLNRGDAAILYCFVFLYLVFAGPGAWSIDAMQKDRAPSR